jgi:hypothetical protein
MVSIEDNAICTSLSRNLDSFLQKTFANALAAILQLYSPSAHNGLAPPSPATFLCGIIIGPTQYQGSNDVLTPLHYDEPVIAQPLHVDFLGHANVTTSHPSNKDKEGHRDTSNGREKHQFVLVPA